ncbi:MAG: tyrosine-type recombinase/integrase [Rikenellaceae bacterium]
MIIDRFINYLLTEKQYSKLTVRAYKDDLCQFLLYTGVSREEFELSKVSSAELRSYVMHLSQQKLKHTSINRKISTLKSFFHYGMKIGVISKDPSLKISLLKKEGLLPSFVPLSTMNAGTTNMLAITDDFVTERDHLILLLFYATGIRLAELIAIQVSDLSFEEMEIRVTGKGNKQRIVPIVSVLEKKMRNYLKICLKTFGYENNLLFLSKKGSCISRSDVYRVVNRQLTVMGVQGKKSPHVLRHSFATHLLNSGAGIETVKELLGHANLSATQIYTHNNISTIIEKYKEAHPRVRK